MSARCAKSLMILSEHCLFERAHTKSLLKMILINLLTFCIKNTPFCNVEVIQEAKNNKLHWRP